MTADLVSLLDTQVLGNSVYTYAFALGLFLATFFGLYILLFVLNNRLKAFVKKEKAHANDVLPQVLRKIYPIEYAGLALYIALQTITLNPLLNKLISIGCITLITYMAIDASSVLLTLLVRRMADNENHQNTAPILINLTIIGKALLWIFGIFIVLSNAGVNITSLIAGLGIGGVAVALGLQSILSDLFSSFAIHFDKPFVVGDLIIVGDQIGVVEKIGIKTTRLRALQGEEIVFANKQLTEAQIQNFKKMRERRVVFFLNVVHETPQQHVREIPALLRSIIENLDMARFDRAHLSRFETGVLTFEIVFYVLSDNYMTYMDTQQQINFGILEAFAEKQIALAYPTQTLHLQHTGPPFSKIEMD